jgi:hypothetical protein
MYKFFRICILIIGFSIGALFVAAQPAHAQWVVTDPGTDTLLGTVQTAITGAITTMMNNTVSSITGLQTSLSTLLTQGFTQEANYAKAQVGAQEQIADASNETNDQFLRNIRNAQVRDDHILSPQACIALDAGQSMTAASVQAAKVSTSIAQVMDARGQAQPGSPAWQGQASAMEAITQLHLARYCDADEQQAGLCTEASAGVVNADQDSSSLFGPASYGDQNTVNAANDYATELIQPVVPAAIRGDALTSVAGQDAEARRRGYNAQMSLARGVLNDVIASRSGAVTLTTAQQQQMLAEGLTQADTGSWFEAVDLEVNRHLSGTDWASSLQYMPEKSVLVEVASELALGNYIAWQTYREVQENATVDAALLAERAQDRLQPIMSMPSPQMAAQ